MQNKMKTVLAMVLMMAGACGAPEEEPSLCDPSGVYPTVATRITGDCAEGVLDTLVISKTGDVWQMMDDGGRVYTGTADLAACTIDAQWVLDEGGIAQAFVYSLEVDEASGTLSGELGVSIVDSTGVPPDVSCTSGYRITSR